MNRIEKKFSDLQKKKQKALVVFITAGDPNLAMTEALIPEMEKEGVDLIEIGVPFSDPLADGPVIQASSQRALSKGVTLEKILNTVRRARQRSESPIALMSYLNPINHYGLEKFAKDAKRAGVDGVIIPDLPPDEGREISEVFKKSGLDLVYLVAPTSTTARQQMILKASRGFVYFVSITGVTGSGKTISKEVLGQVSALRKHSKRAVCVGFGVSTPEQAKEVAKYADGVIVGSSIVRALTENPKLKAPQFVQKFIRPLRLAVQKGD